MKKIISIILTSVLFSSLTITLAQEQISAFINLNEINSNVSFNRDNAKFEIKDGILNIEAKLISDKIETNLALILNINKLENGNLKFFDEVKIGNYKIISTSTDIKIKYNIPSFLPNGKYNVSFKIFESATGKPVNMFVPLIDFDLKDSKIKDGKSFFTDGNCWLNIDKEIKKYSLEGVDLAKDEKLNLSCDLSKLNLNGDYILNYKNYLRSLAVENPENKSRVNSFKQKNISIKNNILSLEIDKENKPQAYDYVFYLSDMKGDRISPEIAVHYIIQGVSATVQDIKYSFNNLHKINYLVTGLATNFPDSRYGTSSLEVLAKLKISDQLDNLIFENQKNINLIGGLQSFDFEIKKNKLKADSNYKAEISLYALDSKDSPDLNSILYSKSLDFKTFTKNTLVNSGLINSKLILAIFLIIILFASLILIFKKFEYLNIRNIILLIIIFLSISIFAYKSLAAMNSRYVSYCSDGREDSEGNFRCDFEGWSEYVEQVTQYASTSFNTNEGEGTNKNLETSFALSQIRQGLYVYQKTALSYSNIYNNYLDTNASSATWWFDSLIRSRTSGAASVETRFFFNGNKIGSKTDYLNTQGSWYAQDNSGVSYFAASSLVLGNNSVKVAYEYFGGQYNISVGADDAVHTFNINKVNVPPKIFIK